jgi:clan AA aspartic protease
MTGHVRGAEARIELELIGPSGRREVVEAVVDTGSSGRLTLPRATIERLGLRGTGNVYAMLADGTIATFDTYEVSVIWNGSSKLIDIEESETTPLIGMSLLKECKLQIEVWSGGSVRIKELTRRVVARV